MNCFNGLNASDRAPWQRFSGWNSSSQHNSLVAVASEDIIAAKNIPTAVVLTVIMAREVTGSLLDRG